MKKNILKGEEHQELLRDIIFFMLETGARREAINNGYADFNYNFTNILAKYYNANDSCRISVESLNLLNEAKIKIPKTVKESDFSRQTFRGSIEYKGIKAVGVISGHGIFGYELALMSAVNIIKNRK